MSGLGTTDSAAVDLADALADVELFASLSDEARRQLAGECRLRAFAAGERIFARGDAGRMMYVVVRGAVALSVATAAGDEVLFDVLRPPASFGELSLIDGGARIATAAGLAPGVLAAVPDAAISRLLRANPDFALAMLAVLARMVRRVDDRLADRTLLDLRARVIKYLTRAAAQAGTRNDASPEVYVHLPLTQEHLARLVGGSRQQVNRIIVDLERCGVIRRQGRQVVSINLREMLQSRSRR